MPPQQQNPAENRLPPGEELTDGEHLRQRVLDKVKSISQEIVERVRRVTGIDGPSFSPPFMS